MRFSYLFLLFIFFGSAVYGQNYDYSQNRYGKDWQIIRTENFRIIFPEEISADAQKLANTMENIREPLMKTMDININNWPVILSNGGSVSNGYVTFGPRKSEFYSPPPQGSLLGTGDWYNLLAIHEGRHMVQYDRMNHGLNRLAYIFVGEVAVNVLSFFSTPMWFWEGDAIITETALTHTGRGRIPEFDVGLRALLLSDIRYNYYKAYNRSYKDYFPNHYTLGYFMVTHVRRHYPVDSWSRICKRTSWFSVNPFRFATSMKRQTGFNARQTYNNTLKELDSLWRKQIEGIEFTAVPQINTKEKNTFTNYSDVWDEGDGHLICLKSGYADAQQIIRINISTGEEKLIKYTAADGNISKGGNMLCWNEIHDDKRWGNESFSNIVVYKPQSGNTKYITQKGRYYAPMLNSDGTKIAAVEFTLERKCRLVIMDSKNGEVLNHYSDADNDYMQSPFWSDDGKMVAFTLQNGLGKRLSLLFTESSEIKDIIPHSVENIASPVFYRDFILYVSPYSGIDQIYAVNINTLERYQVVSRKFGATQPSLSNDGKGLYFLDYDVKGNNIAYIPLDPENWKKIEDVEIRKMNYFEPAVEQESGGNIFAMMQEKKPEEYEVRKYRQGLNMLNFHSWTILPNRYGINLGLSSNDLLKTSELYLGTKYNSNENSFLNNFRFTYAGFYPIIQTDFEFGRRVLNFINDSSTTWDESSSRLKVSIPYIRTKSVWSLFSDLSLEAAYTYIRNKEASDAFTNSNGSFIPITASFMLNNRKMKARRDINSPWAQQLQLSYSFSPMASDYNGSLLSFYSALYFPSLLKHHSIKAEMSYERQNPDNYIFNSRLMFARGYDYIYHDQFSRLALSYELPLFYPDFALGALFYWKRTRFALIADMAQAKDGNNVTLYNSIGAELKFDVHFINFPFEFNFGLRPVYRFQDQKWRLNLLFLDMVF